MESSAPKRRFPPPWRVDQGNDCFRVFDANGVALAVVFCRDDLQRWSFGHGHLTSDEARRVANAIDRLPEFLIQRHGFCRRGGGHERWKPSRPYHVALEDSYIRAHWDEIDALCKLNGIRQNSRSSASLRWRSLIFLSLRRISKRHLSRFDSVC
jgi:hypothetical protein